MFIDLFNIVDYNDYIKKFKKVSKRYFFLTLFLLLFFFNIIINIFKNEKKLTNFEKAIQKYELKNNFHFYKGGIDCLQKQSSPEMTEDEIYNIIIENEKYFRKKG